MKGDLADVIARLFRWLPAGWFPWKSINSDGTVPKVWLTQLGFATILSPIYALLQYIGLQTRTATSTDGWLDLRGWDLLGDWLPRLPGETWMRFLIRGTDRQVVTPSSEYQGGD